MISIETFFKLKKNKKKEKREEKKLFKWLQ